MGKSSAPAPDPRMGEAALKQIALNERIYEDYVGEGGDRDWMRGIANDALGISRTNSERAGALSDYQLDSMRRNDDRYWGTAVPFEDRLLEDVNRFDSDGYKQGLVDKSMNDINIASNNVQGQQLRGMSRMGVNVNSGNFAAMRSTTDNNNALAMASAANKTRMAADQIGLSTKMQMYGGMKGLAGLGATNAGLATGAMGMGLNAAGGMTGAAGASLGANNAAQGAMNAGVSSGISGYGSYVGLQQNATKINNDADPWASIIGAGATLGAAGIGKWG